MRMRIFFGDLAKDVPLRRNSATKFGTSYDKCNFII